MNKTRRKRIDEIILQAEALQLSVDELKEEIEAIKDEEEEYMDNIPEKPGSCLRNHVGNQSVHSY